MYSSNRKQKRRSRCHERVEWMVAPAKQLGVMETSLIEQLKPFMIGIGLIERKELISTHCQFRRNERAQ
jgi:hypothetical protein